MNGVFKRLFLGIFLIVGFIYGATDLEKAQHRLPPVIYSLDIPKQIYSNKTYEFKWSVMGYHTNYKMFLQIYSTKNSEKAIFTKANIKPYKKDKGDYHYGVAQSKRFWFKQDVKLNFNQNQDLIVRFFILPENDLYNYTEYASCLVPGGLGYDVADRSGRKIKIQGKVDSDNNNNSSFLDLPFRGSYIVTQGNHGSTSHYNHGIWDNTYAIDIALPLNTEVIAPADGKVVCIYDEDHKGGKECGFKPKNGCIGGGRVLVFKTNSGDYVTLLHLNSIVASIGEEYSKGELLAYSGGSKGDNYRCLNNGFGYHLHMHLWNHKGTPDSHTKPFDENSKIRVKIDDEIKYLWGDMLNDNNIRGKYFESLQN